MLNSEAFKLMAICKGIDPYHNDLSKCHLDRVIDYLKRDKLIDFEEDELYDYVNSYMTSYFQFFMGNADDPAYLWRQVFSHDEYLINDLAHRNPKLEISYRIADCLQKLVISDAGKYLYGISQLQMKWFTEDYEKRNN